MSQYRDDLEAARLRIAQLEDQLNDRPRPPRRIASVVLTVLALAFVALALGAATALFVRPARIAHAEALPADAPPAECSHTWDTPTTVKWVNASRDRTVQTYWVDYQCREVFYQDVPPGATAVQQTFTTHPWRVRDRATHRLLMDITGARTADPRTFTIP